MPADSFSHNELLGQFLSGLKEAEFSDFELAEIFSGRFDQPIQVALRHRMTQRVSLIDLNRDGTISKDYQG